MISAPLIEYLKKGIFTFLGLILAVYLFVILMTYTGNDPSWSHISSDMTTINNVGGKTGAWLSDLLYSFFGFGAWWLLAFVVYESILIWWDNKPTFWLMRLVAYVFLLLSASALFAQLVALVQQVTNPAAVKLEGVAGGIIGLELQSRLAQLLSQWGSVVFLTAFVIITATFAFNIHWLAIYQRVTALSWLGSGVKRKDVAHDDISISQVAMTSEQNDEHIATDEISKEASEHEHEQLPLELQAADTAQVSDNSGRFSNVLSDFLATSGLADSVKASMAATQAAMSSVSNNGNSDSLQTAEVAPSDTANNTASHTNTSMAASPAMTSARKVEPSFAWNDANTVDDLLASEHMVYSTDNVNVSESAITHSESDNVNDASTVSLDAVAPVNKIMPTQDSSDSALDMPMENVDILADAWLAEHATVSTPAMVQATDEDEATNTVDYSVRETLVESTTDVPSDDSKDAFFDKSSDHHTELSSGANSQAVIEKKVASPVPEIMAEVADMTPTNTPPDNPKTPPVAVPEPVTVVEPIVEPVVKPIVESASEPMIETVAASKAHVSFDIPEGDSSNHIADMMPDETIADDAPVMPHISDDAAFSTKSRSMQTAAYRGSLTPIPEMSILDNPDPNRQPSYTEEKLVELSELLEIKLQEFNVKASVVNAIPGPVVTRFEVELAAGVKASKVTGISRDLARSLSMASLRVVEVIPGKPYIGIEVPNPKREMVRLIELLNTEKFKDPKAQISMAMGKDIGGKPIITDLARAPHMLVAGTTGSGKSVLVNSMLLSMLLKYTPNELRLILIDPKQLELANYNDIPHLLTPVVTDMTEAASALSWCVAEMERRYQLMSLLKVRKLDEFNKKVRAAEQSGNPMLDPLWRPNDSVSISQAPKLKTLPMIVIVADEFADMIMQVGKQAEELITRLAQKSRAAGIHLMLATQRPSVDVITGLIKANIPVRAALRVNSKVDSRTILDSGGAEDMLGNGDMLFLGPGQIEPDRVHGAYVSDEEVNRVCDAWRERGAPDYIDNMAGNFELSSPGSGGSSASTSGEDDDLYNDAVAFIMETRKVSASSIQRKFSIGYNRAARIVDSMEEAGLVSSMGKSGKRELLM